MKILVCTLGKKDTTIYHALRIHKYDKLVLITERELVNRPEFKRILSLEGRGQFPIKTIIVDTSNFWDCYNKVYKYLQRTQKGDIEIIFNISGGEKLLSMASILCAFNLGVETYHYEAGRFTSLPVIRGLLISDRFSKLQMNILKKIRNKDSLKSLVNRIKSKDMPEEKIIREIRSLIKMGILEKERMDGDIRFHITDSGKIFRKYINQ